MNDFKKKMNEKIKLYSNDKYLENFFKNEFEMSEGEAHVYMYLNDKSELFDYRTMGDQLSLNLNVYEYIEDKTSMLENDVKINFHVRCPDVSKKE